MSAPDRGQWDTSIGVITRDDGTISIQRNLTPQQARAIASRLTAIAGEITPAARSYDVAYLVDAIRSGITAQLHTGVPDDVDAALTELARIAGTAASTADRDDRTDQ
ncbi:MAG: hypothetical protein WBD41_00740 [Rhodococcus sp. (in: high G+C Gram-positive bacteria)]